MSKDNAEYRYSVRSTARRGKVDATLSGFLNLPNLPMADFSVNGALFPQSADDLKKRLGERFDPRKNTPNSMGC